VITLQKAWRIKVLLSKTASDNRAAGARTTRHVLTSRRRRKNESRCNQFRSSAG